MLESLPVEQQPIAQQLLRGGIPAVRTALHFERERAREAGRPEPSTEGVLALAESLVSRVKAAEWRDRAEAAIKAGDDLAMRDLRSLVSGSDAARDEASRDLVVTLREMLERRVEANRVAWADEVTKNLDEGHVVRALRLSSRPPDASARFSAELATRLRDAASAALIPGYAPRSMAGSATGCCREPRSPDREAGGAPGKPEPRASGHGAPAMRARPGIGSAARHQRAASTGPCAARRSYQSAVAPPSGVASSAQAEQVLNSSPSRRRGYRRSGCRRDGLGRGRH